MSKTPNQPQSNRKGMLLSVLSVVCVIVFSVTGFVYKMTAPRIMSPKELVNNGAVMYEEPRSLLPFELVTDAEQPFTPNNIQGKWTLLFFGFSHCPDFCPTTLATLRSLVGQLDTDLQKNLQVVMVSVDPARDTPQRLREYFAGFQFNEENTDFVGVTGEFFHIKVLADQFYIPFQKKIIAAEPTDHSAHMSTHEGGDMTEHLMDKGEMDNSEHMGETANTENNYTMVHGESIVLINPQGQLQGFFSPPFTVSRLKTTLRSIITVYEKQ